MLESGTNSSDEKVTDHDLLVVLSRDMTWVKKLLTKHDNNWTNHLSQHWVTSAGVVVALLAAVGTLVMYIITRG